LDQGPELWDQDPYGEWYWQTWDKEYSSCSFPTQGEGIVWARSESSIYAWTENYSNLEVYAGTSINSSIEICYEWVGGGTPTGGCAEYYYTFYSGDPYDPYTGDSLVPSHYAYALNSDFQNPAEVSLGIETYNLACITPIEFEEYDLCYTENESGLIVNSINTIYCTEPQCYCTEPQLTYYWPTLVNFNVALIDDPWSPPIHPWDYYWDWEVYIGCDEYLNPDYCYAWAYQGDSLISLTLAVGNYTYAYSNLDEDSKIYGENNSYTRSRGFIGLW